MITLNNAKNIIAAAAERKTISSDSGSGEQDQKVAEAGIAVSGSS